MWIEIPRFCIPNFLMWTLLNSTTPFLLLMDESVIKAAQVFHWGKSSQDLNFDFYEFLHFLEPWIDHSVIKWKIYYHQKKFRQINYLVFALVKMLLSRNFLLRKCESKSPFLPHCVDQIRKHQSPWNGENSSFRNSRLFKFDFT